MTDVSYVADFRIEGAWFNRSLSSFAIVPDALDTDPKQIAALLETLVDSYRNASEAKHGSLVKYDVLAELYDLHARGLILWPLAFYYGQSVLGELTSYRMNNHFAEEDPIMFEIRDDLERSKAFEQVKDAGKRAKDLSFEFWRIFITFRLATASPTLRGIEDITETHLYALVDAMLDGSGAWADWVPVVAPRRLRKFRNYLAIEFSDSEFAVGFMNSRRRGTAGARNLAATARSPHLVWITTAFERWLDGRVALTRKNERHALALLLEFMSSLPPERTKPEEAFKRDNVKALFAFAQTWRKPIIRKIAIGKIREFAEWYYLNFATKNDLSKSFSMTRYDVEQFTKSIPSHSARVAEVTARPMPTRFHFMLAEIISENDFAWTKSITDRNTGLPLHWIPWTDPETGKTDSIFCEVLPRMLLLQLELPLRNIQVRRLDSGEGDEREYDPKTKRWQNATGLHAGYWKRIGAKNPRRGVIREIRTKTGEIAGFWINSNKTRDGQNLFDERSGYEIPWQHDSVIENLTAMRKWQEKYNPVKSPLPHAKLPRNVFHEEPSRAIRAVLPDRFYLFRFPQNNWDRGHEAPVSYRIFLQFFLDALDQLEKRLRQDDPASDITIITDRDTSGRPRKAIFTMHGMRSSTLTSLHMAGVPIGVLSKLVAGHATILMTLRYTKFDPAHVNEILIDARSKISTEARGQFENFLKSATMEHAMRMTARLSDDGIQQAKNSYGEPSGWTRLDIGICPNGATLCHIGGEAIHRKVEKTGRNKSPHKPVSGGVRNCVRCRFFVTGVPFLIPLWAQALANIAKIDQISRRISELSDEIQAAKLERLSLGDAVPETLRQRIRILEETFYSETDARDQALADVHATIVYVEKVRAIAAEDANDETKLPMLLGEEGAAVSFRESTRFELIDAVVQASRWFPSISSPELEAERDEFLNHVLWRNGYVPITLSALKPDERRKSADALAQLLLVELGASETQNVIEGRKTLAELGLQERLEDAARAAIGRPIERLTFTSTASTAGLSNDRVIIADSSSLMPEQDLDENQGLAREPREHLQSRTFLGSPAAQSRDRRSNDAKRTSPNNPNAGEPIDSQKFLGGN